MVGRSIANLAQFTGQSTANIIARDLGSYAWPLWISAGISLVSLLCAVGVLLLDNFLRRRYTINDKTGGGTISTGVLKQGALRQFSTTFWIVVLFCVFENAGVQSFVSISTFVWIKPTTISLTLTPPSSQSICPTTSEEGYSCRRLGIKLLPASACCPLPVPGNLYRCIWSSRVHLYAPFDQLPDRTADIYIRSVYVRCVLPSSDAALEALAQYPYFWHVVNLVKSSQVDLMNLSCTVTAYVFYALAQVCRGNYNDSLPTLSLRRP
jgi:hypothetical protein